MPLSPDKQRKGSIKSVSQVKKDLTDMRKKPVRGIDYFDAVLESYRSGRGGDPDLTRRVSIALRDSGKEKKIVSLMGNLEESLEQMVGYVRELRVESSDITEQTIAEGLEELSKVSSQASVTTDSYKEVLSSSDLMTELRTKYGNNALAIYGSVTSQLNKALMDASEDKKDELEELQKSINKTRKAVVHFVQTDVKEMKSGFWYDVIIYEINEIACETKRFKQNKKLREEILTLVNDKKFINKTIEKYADELVTRICVDSNMDKKEQSNILKQVNGKALLKDSRFRSKVDLELEQMQTDIDDYFNKELPQISVETIDFTRIKKLAKHSSIKTVHDRKLVADKITKKVKPKHTGLHKDMKQENKLKQETREIDESIKVLKRHERTERIAYDPLMNATETKNLQLERINKTMNSVFKEFKEIVS